MKNSVGLSLYILAMFSLSMSVTAMAAGSNNIQQTVQENGAYNERSIRGFDPANITCNDANGDGMMSQDECSWGDTSTPWFQHPELNTQYGAGVIPGGSGAQLEQSADITIGEPHFAVRFYNVPSAPDTTATSGVTSGPSGNLRAQHNEFGFEVVVDKKTDPLEPYYLKFYIPYTTVDSTQDSGGVMSGNASGTYYKEITEMNPMNPGVFNRYTVTGTFTSTGDGSYNATSSCESGCTSDEEWSWRSQWP